MFAYSPLWNGTIEDEFGNKGDFKRAQRDESGLFAGGPLIHPLKFAYIDPYISKSVFYPETFTIDRTPLVKLIDDTYTYGFYTIYYKVPNTQIYVKYEILSTDQTNDPELYMRQEL